jgi:hypothetical protein
VTNEQLYVMVGLPLLFNASLIGILMAWANAKLSAMYANFEGRFAAMEAKSDGRFAATEARFNAIEKRLDDLKDLWRSELHRVEEILDARLKHIEERP